MNADVFYNTGIGVLGTNMFAYSVNNPASFFDPNGKSPTAIILTTVGIPTSVLMCAAGILVIAMDLATGGKIILTLSEAISYLLTYIADSIAIVWTASKIPNNLKTDDGKFDLDKSKNKLPGDQGYRGPGKWRIQKDTAGHGGRKWKLYKGKDLIASLLEDGTISNYY